MFEQFEIEDNLIIGNRNSKEMKVEGMVSNIFTNEGRNNNMSIQESATIKQEIAIQVQCRTNICSGQFKIRLVQTCKWKCS